MLKNVASSLFHVLFHVDSRIVAINKVCPDDYMACMLRFDSQRGQLVANGMGSWGEMLRTCF